MDSSPAPAQIILSQANVAPQHGPRPLPLFLQILWRETQHDPTLRRRAFAGLRRYQQAQRIAGPPEPETIATVGSARLLRYGVENGAAPVVFVPSLINPAAVLDLSQNRSLLRDMAAAKHDAWLIDWGTPTRDDVGLGLAAHVTDRLVPLLAALPRPPIMIGYCLGGTLALAAAILAPVQALATIAAPWRFDSFTDTGRAEIAGLWQRAKPTCERLGYVPMEVLQSGFWAMDPARTVQKYAAFADMPEGSDSARAFLALEDWANAGAPLTYAAGCDLFERLYAGNATGKGQWMVGGSIVDPAAIACPTLSIRSTTDHIVPAAASPLLAQDWQLHLGHVGMVVSGRARETLWQPLSRWVSSHGG